MTYTWQPEKIISTDKLFKMARAYVMRKQSRTFEQISKEMGVAVATAFDYCKRSEELIDVSNAFQGLIELEERKIGV